MAAGFFRGNAVFAHVVAVFGVVILHKRRSGLFLAKCGQIGTILSDFVHAIILHPSGFEVCAPECSKIVRTGRTKRTVAQTIGAQGFRGFCSFQCAASVRNCRTKIERRCEKKLPIYGRFYMCILCNMCPCSFCSLFFRLPPCARARIGGSCFFGEQNERCFQNVAQFAII